ncbi:MV heparin binding surface protein [Cotia virus SPAn232]|uniref:MV heparin binding surface protein n=2 Tax=Cotia virus TaxID=39444 RepID=H6TA64_9POXV|nr:MV heparin binding surface protein [Cotia virus SPAn232]ADT91104.1 MV heparin binding surface protein [Cotia virus SPAn232]AIT70705.1 MV heparin binding surface protein [Cotia virus]
MAAKPKEDNETVPVFIIPIVNRPPEDVFPTIPDAKTKSVDLQAVLDDKTPGVNNHDNIPTLLYRYYLWKKVEKSNVDNFKEYFTGICNVLCTSESKKSMANHFSLWEAYKKVNITDQENKFIVVIEDENTLFDSNFLTEVITAMYKKNIDILQLKETLYNGNTRSLLLAQDSKNTIYTYTGGYDFCLSAYIIRISKMKELITSILNMGGISTSLNFEMTRLEKDLNINRQVLNEAYKFVESDKKSLSHKRIENMKSSIWNRLGLWASNRFPHLSYIMTNPLFSFFGLFDITVLGVCIILFTIILMIFNVNSNLLWFIAGALFTYVVYN